MAWFIYNAIYAWLRDAGDWSDTGSVNKWLLSLNVFFVQGELALSWKLEAMSHPRFGKTFCILFLSGNSVLEFIEMIRRNWFVLIVVACECVWPPHFYKLLCLYSLMIDTFGSMPYIGIWICVFKECEIVSFAHLWVLLICAIFLHAIFSPSVRWLIWLSFKPHPFNHNLLLYPTNLEESQPSNTAFKSQYRVHSQSVRRCSNNCHCDLFDPASTTPTWQECGKYFTPGLGECNVYFLEISFMPHVHTSILNISYICLHPCLSLSLSLSLCVWNI